AVAAWCRAHGVRLHEWSQFGVVRGLRERDGWQRQRDAFMAAPVVGAPARIEPAWPAEGVSVLPQAGDLGLTDADAARRQRGGRREGLSELDGFLGERSQRYRGGISSPLSAAAACSRLSPYLAHGCLGLREVEQATQAWLAQLAPDARTQRLGLQGFQSRLAWHCHFIQKLESEPELEWRNLHRGYDGLREGEWSAERFGALVQGRTGWPLVDACVAMLRETGWLNFRMRAMLVSVAAYPLWLHWREVGLWLARQFVDYEPGIHWSQLQMQSGTTGINTTRVYNPLKQARDHDPHGRFVRRWLPAMRRVPDAWLFEPWRMPAETQARCGVRVGVDIPMPVVDLDVALRQAKARMHALRARPEVQAAEAEVVRRHASRAGRREQPARRRSAAERTQQSLF
ncbi:MAG: deoxyribodipyrimidine photolyase, partial [Burkholderiales bacterium]